MEWMINTQLGRRNLPPAQRLAVMDKFKKKIQEQAKENMSIGGSSDKKGSQNGETLIKKQTHTDKELAKMAGVGTGTVAEYCQILELWQLNIGGWCGMKWQMSINVEKRKLKKIEKSRKTKYNILDGKPYHISCC